jgi:uncharacterized protein YceH (UPF0502 family)
MEETPLVAAAPETPPYLSPNEARALGALIEKEITTPDYYPMTLNALTAACNQKSNRSPVLRLSEQDVQQAFDEARKKTLGRIVDEGAARTPKYRQRLVEIFQLTPAQTAIFCELLLRGAQTPGELRSRAERMYAFTSLAEVETVLTELSSESHHAVGIVGRSIVVRLPRQSGQKEARYAHTLCGAPEETRDAPETARETAQSGEDEYARKRILALEEELAALKQELQTLTEKFEALRRQFE